MDSSRFVAYIFEQILLKAFGVGDLLQGIGA